MSLRSLHRATTGMGDGCTRTLPQTGMGNGCDRTSGLRVQEDKSTGIQAEGWRAGQASGSCHG